MATIAINDNRTKEVLKGKKRVAEINPAIFQGYADVIINGEVTAVVLEIDEVNGKPSVIAEAYPEDLPMGTLPATHAFPFTEETTIKELLNSVSASVEQAQ